MYLTLGIRLVLQVGKDFPKSKVHEKTWKSVKLT